MISNYLGEYFRRSRSQSAATLSLSNRLGRIRFDGSSVISGIIVLMFASYYFSLARVNGVYFFYSVAHRILIPILGLYLVFLRSRGKRLLYCSELLAGFGLIIALGLITSFCFIVNGTWSDKFWDGIFYLAWPMLLGFIIINLFKKRQISNLMTGILACTFAAYCLDLGNQGALSISGFSSISLSTSYSPFESSPFSGISFALAAYFCVNRDRKISRAVSVLFCFMTFKRVFLLFLPILFFGGMSSKIAKTMPSKGSWAICAIATVVCSILYFFLLLPDNTALLDAFLTDKFGLDIFQFTMGRDTQLYSLLLSGYESYGYMSTLMWNENYVEMEFCRIFLETGVLGVSAFAFYFWYISRNNRYSLLYMSALIINLIMSWSLSSFNDWFLSYIVLYSIQMVSTDNCATSWADKRLN